MKKSFFWGAGPVSIIGWNSWLTRHDANFKKLTQWVQIVFEMAFLFLWSVKVHLEKAIKIRKKKFYLLSFDATK